MAERQFLYFYSFNAKKAMTIYFLGYFSKCGRRLAAAATGLLAAFSSGGSIASALPAAEKQVDSLLFRADSLRKAYLFNESLAIYDDALMQCSDSLQRIGIEDAKMLSENGLGMTDFVLQPTVVAKHRFSLEDFFLYYPLDDRSWRPVPNVLDTVGNHPFYKAVYFPGDSRTVYYSAPDSGGSMNINRIDKKDSTWSVPSLLNEYLVSSGDEIYPMLSPDRKHLYFASSGLYGMGGFDLYVSVWNEDQQEWGPPSNMGMPYSSPYNDFLFINTPDGKYSIFASDRDCPNDSVDVYVLEYVTMPVRKSVGDVSRLRKIMALDPEDDMTRLDTGAAVSKMVPEDAGTRAYTDKVAEVRALKDSIYFRNVRLDNKRAAFAESTDPSFRDYMSNEILKDEAVIPVLQDSLDRASKELQRIEMEFLFKGIVLDPDKLETEADRELEGETSNYVFTKMSLGAPLDIVVEEPEVKFDYTFMILPEGRFAEDNTLPDGIVYQIQIFSLSSRAGVKSLKGLSPVFEEISPAGRYIYRVGVFRTYNDVLSNLNKVKKLGFRTAYVTAFLDGEPISVSKARTLEKKTKTVSLYQINIVPYDGTLPELAVSAVEQICGKKDIARTEKDGKITYIVGTFDDRSTVEKVMVAVRATGVADVTYVKIGTKEITQ